MSASHSLPQLFVNGAPLASERLYLLEAFRTYEVLLEAKRGPFNFTYQVPPALQPNPATQPPPPAHPRTCPDQLCPLSDDSVPLRTLGLVSTASVRTLCSMPMGSRQLLLSQPLAYRWISSSPAGKLRQPALPQRVARGLMYNWLQRGGVVRRHSRSVAMDRELTAQHRIRRGRRPHPAAASPQPAVVQLPLGGAHQAAICGASVPQAGHLGVGGATVRCAVLGALTARRRRQPRRWSSSALRMPSVWPPRLGTPR